MELRERIGKYRIIRPIGQGAEGNVYLAQDEDLCRKVAIKQVYKLPGQKSGEAAQAEGNAVEDGMPQEAGSKEEKETDWKSGYTWTNKRILQEADILRQLKHPMLPVVYDLLWEDDLWYMVMEYIQGMTLQEYVEKNDSIEEKQVYIWAEQLLNIMCYLHTRKPPVIYRDLKPQNVMVCPDNHLKLIDFGAAYWRNFGACEMRMAATPGYSAPEQFGHTGQGIRADERSDIYAFGMLLYFTVTGMEPTKPPYTSLPVRDYQPLLGDWVESIIRRCIRKDPSERYQMVQEIQKELHDCGGHHAKRMRRSFIRVVEKKVWLTEME